MAENSFIICKNIPLTEIEKIINKCIVFDKIIELEQSIELKIKNSRTCVIFFPDGIININLSLLALKLKEYSKNDVSLPEIVAVFENKVLESFNSKIEKTKDYKDVFELYKISINLLHTMLIIKPTLTLPKKWWQIWK